MKPLHLISNEIYSGPKRSDDLTFGQAVFVIVAIYISFIVLVYLWAAAVTPTAPDNQQAAVSVSAQQ